MASAVIDLSIRRAEKMSRGRMMVRVFLVIAAAAAVLAMTFLPDPSGTSGRGQETRKGGAPAVSAPSKPTVGLTAPSTALHLA